MDRRDDNSSRNTNANYSDARGERLTYVPMFTSSQQRYLEDIFLLPHLQTAPGTPAVSASSTPALSPPPPPPAAVAAPVPRSSSLPATALPPPPLTKEEARKVRNRASAAKSRQRAQDSIRTLEERLAVVQRRHEFLKREVRRLTQSLQTRTTAAVAAAATSTSTATRPTFL